MIYTKKSISMWKYSVLIPVFSLSFLIASGQDPISKESEVYTVVDQPAAPKSYEDFTKFLQKTIRYPYVARSGKEQGKIFVAVVVEKDGAITNPNIVQGISPSLDAEALRVVGLSTTVTAWNPGKNKGEAVRMTMLIPIVFKLDGVEQTNQVTTEPEGIKIPEVVIVAFKTIVN